MSADLGGIAMNLMCFIFRPRILFASLVLALRVTSKAYQWSGVLKRSTLSAGCPPIFIKASTFLELELSTDDCFHTNLS